MMNVMVRGEEKRSDITMQDIVDMILMLDRRVESGFYTVNSRIDAIEIRLKEITRVQVKFAEQLDIVQDDIKTLFSYFDVQAEQMFKHDKRIKKLETKCV